MNITFIPLTKTHFPLLLQWLQMPHVKNWWDDGIEWTLEFIEQKYTDYINGQKPIKAFVICTNNHLIGYIQYYNIQDFPRKNALPIMPSNCASLDFYIGEEKYLNKGIGTKALDVFMNEYIFNEFKAVFVDPDKKNLAAIKTYEKAGFKLLQPKDWYFKNYDIVPLLKYEHPLRLAVCDRVAIEASFCENFPRGDSLWVFGSRVDMSRRGGDIDLYIETNIEDIPESMNCRTKFWSQLQNELGDQRIDIVLNNIKSKYELPIYEVARKEGLKIV